MTFTQAIAQLEALKFAIRDRATLDALDLALACLRDREAHWKQQGEIADKGGHGPGSDF